MLLLKSCDKYTITLHRIILVIVSGHDFPIVGSAISAVVHYPYWTLVIFGHMILPSVNDLKNTQYLCTTMYMHGACVAVLIRSR